LLADVRNFALCDFDVEFDVELRLDFEFDAKRDDFGVNRV
jgi:hypothetical protein